MARFASVSRHANKGKGTETQVQNALDTWQRVEPLTREYNRLLDSKAARRIVKTAPADFDYYADGTFGLIEAKETEHSFRLPKARVTQFASMLKRHYAGGVCGIVVYHSKDKVYRGVPMDFLVLGADKPSWDLTPIPAVPTASEALCHIWEGFACP